MPSAKKTTGNFLWLLWMAVVVLVAPKFLFAQTESLQVSLKAKSNTCEIAEFFAGTSNPGKLPTYTHAVFPPYQITQQPDIFIATGILKKPFAVLRVDPCTRANETLELVELKLSDNQKTTIVPLTQISIECTNCQLEITAQQTLLVKTTSGDPQLFFKDLDPKLFEYGNHWLAIYQMLTKVAFIIALLVILLQCGSLIIKFKYRTMAIFCLSNFLAAASFYLLYKKRFGLGRNLPFGADLNQTGLAFVHLNFYSRYTDMVLYMVPLGISLFIIGVSLWFLKKQK